MGEWKEEKDRELRLVCKIKEDFFKAVNFIVNFIRLLSMGKL